MLKYIVIAIAILLVSILVYEVVGRKRKRARLLVPDECTRCREKLFRDGLCWSCWHGRNRLTAL